MMNLSNSLVKWCDMKTISQILAKEVVDVYKDKTVLTVVTRKLLKLYLTDILGLMVAGARSDIASIVLSVNKQFMIPGNSTVIMHKKKLHPVFASFLNAVFGHAYDFDDTLIPYPTHITSSIFSVTLAMAENEKSSISDFLLASLLGIEVAGRIAAALPDMLAGGIHPPLVINSFACAISSGLLLGLNEQQLSNALGICGSYVGGVTEYANSGGESKRLHNAIPAQHGVYASLYAQNGLTGPLTIFEGNKGIAAFSSTVHLEKLTEPFSDIHYLPLIGLKKYSCCSFTHPTLQEIEHITQNNLFPIDHIQRIVIHISEFAYHMIAKIVQPVDILGAHFSLKFLASYTFLIGKVNTSLNHRHLNDPSIQELAKKIIIESRPFKDKFEGEMIITLSDDCIITKKFAPIKGSINNPLTHDEIITKFCDCVSHSFTQDEALDLVQAIDGIDSYSSIAELMSYFVKPSTH